MLMPNCVFDDVREGAAQSVEVIMFKKMLFRKNASWIGIRSIKVLYYTDYLAFFSKKLFAYFIKQLLIFKVYKF